MGNELYRFGPFELDPLKRRLLRDGQPVALFPKAFDALVILISYRGKDLSRAELAEKIWPDTSVSEHNLNQCIAVVRRALEDDPRNPEYIATLPGRGYSFIANVEMLRDGKAPETALLLSPGVTAGAASPQAPTEVITPKTHRPTLAVLAAALSGIAIVLAVFAIRADHLITGRKSPSTTPTPGPHLKVRPSVAVLKLQNLTGRRDANWLSTALAEMLSTEIGAGGRLRVISGESVARSENELKITPFDGLSRTTLAQVQQILRAQFIISGGYTLVGPARAQAGQIRLDLRVQDASSGRTVATSHCSGKLSNLFTLVSLAGATLRKDLNAEPISRANRLEARATSPANLTAARLYAEGLSRLRDFDPLGARRLLQRATASDPSFPLAYLNLSEADESLGYQAQAQASAKRAFELSSHLSREKQLWIKAQYEQSQQEWAKAIKTYQALRTFYPDSIVYGLRLADAQMIIGKRQQALQTLAQLRKLPSSLADDPRIDIEEAQVWQALSDYKRALIPAGRAADEAHARGAQWLYAKALTLEAGSLASLNNYDPRSLALDDKARKICTELGDESCVANVYRRLGYRLVDTNPAGAEKALRQSLLIARRVGNRTEAANDLNGLAAIYSSEGRYESADKIYRRFLADARRSDDVFGTQMFLNNLGEDEMQEGDLTAAKRMEQEAVAISKKSGQEIGVAFEETDLGRIEELEGDLKGARAFYIEARVAIQKIGTEKELMSEVLSGLAEISRDRGYYRKAETDYKKALALLSVGRSDGQIASTRVALARVELDEGRSRKALSLAQEALGGFKKLSRPQGESRARVVIGQALMDEGKLQAAVVEANRGRRLVAETQGRLTTLMVEIGAARIDAAEDLETNSPDLRADLYKLEATANRAQSIGLTPLALEARLAIGIVELKSGSQGAPARLARIEAEAHSIGLLRIVYEARASSPPTRLAVKLVFPQGR